jgi:tripartite-type tricarboxylate transporter receptor subunit TctC
MTLPRRRFLHLAGAAAVIPAAPRFAHAQAYPARPVHLIVMFPPGNAPDIIARLAGQSLSERLGQQFVIENKPGAGGNLATEYVAASAPDGYTVLLSVSSNTVNEALGRYAKISFTRDLVPVAGIGKTPYVLVTPASFPAKTLPQFIAHLKANSGKVDMASSGPGSGPHIAGELFQLMTGTRMQHVPYKGSYMPDIISGQVQALFAPIAQALALIREGKLRALGVTYEQRAAVLPDVPAIGEVVTGYETFGWYGLTVPARTPPAVVKRLGDAMLQGLADPAMPARMSKMGVDPLPMTADAFARHIAEEVGKWSQVIKAQGIVVK